VTHVISHVNSITIIIEHIIIVIIMGQRTEPIHTEGEYVTEGSAPFD
jgi:hypothetical protein